jgi:hypothetical protein
MATEPVIDRGEVVALLLAVFDILGELRDPAALGGWR